MIDVKLVHPENALMGSRLILGPRFTTVMYLLSSKIKSPLSIVIDIVFDT